MQTRSIHLPKYFQIMQEILEMIRGGQLAPGTRIDSEKELIERFGISNTTARKVHQELERAGWVARIKGKGTFVNNSRVDRSADRILGFTKNMIEAGRKPSTQVIDVKMRKRGHSLTLSGRRYVLPGPICKIKRLRLADGTAMMKDTRYVSESLCPGIHAKALDQSLYDIYERDYGLYLTQIDQRLSTAIVDGQKMGFPDVVEEIPVFRVEGVTFCGKGLILEMEESIYRGDKYCFSVRATE